MNQDGRSLPAADLTMSLHIPACDLFVPQQDDLVYLPNTWLLCLAASAGPHQLA